MRKGFAGNEPLRYLPVTDDVGIIGYNWKCECGEILRFVSGGELCRCGFKVPDICPDDWYDEQLKKPIEGRDWNLLANKGNANDE